MTIRATLVTLAVTTLLPVAASPAEAQETITSVREDTSKRPHFTNAPGRVWVVHRFALRPAKANLSGGGARGCFALDVVTDAGGSLRVFFVLVVPGPIPQGPPIDPPADFTAVAFDEQGHRYPLKLDHGMKSRTPDPGGAFSMWHMGFTLDPKVLAPDRGAYLGIERVPDKPR
jgi:hypothetical protein